MQYIYILLLLIIIVIGFYFYKQKSIVYSTPKDKKQQIKNDYIKQLNDALNDAKSNEEKKVIKLKYIKKFNEELSRNIFFTQQESKELLSILSKL
jgi:hypothetical protein